jgi:(p)ppGpp synthase/HD superfamily hydrolase
MSDKIERARLLAEFVHFGQKRQDGEDYINHPQRVVNIYIETFVGKPQKMFPFAQSKKPIMNLTLEQENLICAAWLHDTVEDYKNEFCKALKYDPIPIIIRGTFGNDIANLISILTHLPDESYNEYMEVVSQNPEALTIKWADMIDNTSYPIPKKQWEKYRSALIHLIGLGNPISIPSILTERLELEKGDKI